MRLRPGLSVLWRCEGESQIGTDPRCAVVLGGLTAGEQQVLDHLRHGPTEADLLRVGKTAGVSPARVRELVSMLDRGGVLDRREGARPLPPHVIEPAEPAYWARITPGGEGAAVVELRDRAVVAVVGLGQVGVRVARHLAEAGVGTVLLEDDSPVGRQDLGAYHPRDLGRPRRSQAEAELRSAFPMLRTTADDAARPDLVITVTWGVVDPVRLRELMREDVPHLPVVLGDVDLAVGPLVVPGNGPCTRCLDLHRTDADEAWPAVATQLRGRTSPGTAATAAQLGAAIAAHQVVAWLDGRELVIRRSTLEVSGLSPLPALRRWDVHPECGCAAPVAGVPVGARRARGEPGAGASPAGISPAGTSPVAGAASALVGLPG